ncbi:ABC transporter permease subunit [bacterium]|nr:ABC transporter permease subunit [bacterium]
MKNNTAIFKREFTSFFNSTIAYIFITVFLILSYFFFFKSFFINGFLSMRSFFDMTPWILLFFIPSVTMKIWAEEKRSKTNEILFTLPVSDWNIIMGKFWGAYLFVILTILLTINIPITLLFLGKIDLGPIVGGYLGLFFLAGVYISIGMFTSSITSNQIIAYILGAAIGFIFYVISQQFVIFTASAFFTKLFTTLGLSYHYSSISRGVMDIYDIVYFIGFTAIFLFLNYIVVKKRI